MARTQQAWAASHGRERLREGPSRHALAASAFVSASRASQAPRRSLFFAALEPDHPQGGAWLPAGREMGRNRSDDMHTLHLAAERDGAEALPRVQTIAASGDAVRGRMLRDGVRARGDSHGSRLGPFIVGRADATGHHRP